MLGKFPREVARECTAEDIAHWIAYDKVKTSLTEKRRKKNKKGNK